MLSRQQTAVACVSDNIESAATQRTSSSLTHARTLSFQLRECLAEISEVWDGTESGAEETPHDMEGANGNLQRTLSEAPTEVSGADNAAEFQRAVRDMPTVASAADKVAKLQRTLSEVSTATSGSLFGDSKVIEEELEMLKQEKAAIEELKAAVEMKIRKVSKNLRQLQRGRSHPELGPHLPPGVTLTRNGTWIDTPESRHISGTKELPTIRHGSADSLEVWNLLTTNITREDLGESSTPRG